MRILKSHPLLKLVNSYVIDSPQPSNLSYLWNFGSLLAVCLIIQIITGVTLGMHYTPSVLEAFDSVEHIMRDVNNGWLVRYLHSNTASAFFFLVYLHIGRGLYYGSYKAPRTLTWTIGTVIFILMMATAFLGFSHSPKWFKSADSVPTNKNSDNRNYDKDSDTTKKFLESKNLKPVFTYEDLKNQRANIKKDTVNLAGVYLILNKVTLDYYIGSASTDRIHIRFTNHLINFTGSKMVKLAVRKYGLDNFAFIVLEVFPVKINAENNKQLLDLEDFYLKSLLPNYNILTEAGSSFGYKHTEIDRIKMKAIYSNKRREAIGSLNRGKILSEETSRSPRKFSEEVLANMKKKSVGIKLHNLSNNVLYGEYSSITEAAKSISCDVKTITRALNTEKKNLLKRWKVSYV